MYSRAGCTRYNYLVSRDITVLYTRFSYLQYFVGFLRCTLVYISNISEIEVHLTWVTSCTLISSARNCDVTPFLARLHS